MNNINKYMKLKSNNENIQIEGETNTEKNKNPSEYITKHKQKPKEG